MQRMAGLIAGVVAGLYAVAQNAEPHTVSAFPDVVSIGLTATVLLLAIGFAIRSTRVRTVRERRTVGLRVTAWASAAFGLCMGIVSGVRFGFERPAILVTSVAISAVGVAVLGGAMALAMAHAPERLSET